MWGKIKLTALKIKHAKSASFCHKINIRSPSNDTHAQHYSVT